VTTPATGTAPGPVKVKVVALIVAGFMATPKVAVTVVFGQTPAAPLRGTEGFTVAGTKLGLVPGLQHPTPTSNSSAVNQIL
jgi:hypothetical protein